MVLEQVCFFLQMQEMILLFDELLCEQGRNFSNKIWNAFRLISSWEIR